jgi:Cytochrome C oxidase, cbb3-type, subunit III
MGSAYTVAAFKFNSCIKLCGIIVIAAAIVGCGRSERMDALYVQRCLSCHGSIGKGDGRMAAALPVTVPDFRNTVERRSTGQIRRIITEGRGMMPAFKPALSPGEINDMVRMVRFLSREGRDVAWWEKSDILVSAHCNIPWDAVLADDEPLEPPQTPNRTPKG